MSESPLRVALVFEYPTLNGGENSMLAVMPRLIASQLVEPVALAEPVGPLAERLGELSIPVVPFHLRDDSGVKAPLDVAVERLVQAVRQSCCQLAHSNSLSMGRLLGAAADCLSIPTTSHLRDILKLSQAAIRDLNRNRRLIPFRRRRVIFMSSRGSTPIAARLFTTGSRQRLSHQTQSVVSGCVVNWASRPARL